MNDDIKIAVQKRILSSGDDLVLLARIGIAEHESTAMELVLDEMDGNSDTNTFIFARATWRVFANHMTEVDSGNPVTYISLLKLRGRCLNRHVQPDGYCPDCHLNHSKATHSKRSKDELVKWWKENNPHMLADNAAQPRVESVGNAYMVGDIADFGSEGE